MVDRTVIPELADLLESAGVLVAAFNEKDQLRFANAAFRSAWFIGETEQPTWIEMMRRNYPLKRGSVVTTDDFEDWGASTRARRGKTPFRAYETDLHDGRWLWMTETMKSNGWMLCVASDITSIRPDERSLRQERDLAIRASITDDLTGIPSRRFVLDKLSDLVSGGIAGSGAGCLAILDVDNFKYINDRFGHLVGDSVLRNFTEILQRLVRTKDVLGRVGGEEFALLLPDTTPLEAEAIVGRMLDAVRISRPVADQASFRYTFSAGITAISRGEDPTDVYRRADLALYAAKMRGRNQIAIDTNADLSPRLTG